MKGKKEKTPCPYCGANSWIKKDPEIGEYTCTNCGHTYTGTYLLTSKKRKRTSLGLIPALLHEKEREEEREALRPNYPQEGFEEMLEKVFQYTKGLRSFHATREAAAAVLRCHESEVLETAYQLGYDISYIGSGWFSFITSEKEDEASPEVDPEDRR